MAYQALEGVLKLAKIPSVKVPISRLVPEAGSVQVTKPGVREDNECLQAWRGWTQEPTYPYDLVDFERLEVGA